MGFEMKNIMAVDTKTDHHMHTVFSDGVAGIDEMASTAIQKGFREITITDHMPLPFQSRYAMQPDDIDKYRREIELAGQKYEGQIRVKKGLEFEYFPSFEKWIRSIVEREWDHLLVSTHNLMIDHRPYIVNGTQGEFKSLAGCFDHNMEEVCTRYYKMVQTSVRTGFFDIVGHLDVIKKHNRRNLFFSESSPWYKTLVLETLDTIRQNDMKIEVNMAGINHPVGEQYPSRWIVREAIVRDIQIVLGSDAHQPEALGQYFDRMDRHVTKGNHG